MFVRITSKRQVTLSTKVLQAMGVQEGDVLEIISEDNCYKIKPRRVHLEKLAPLREAIKANGKFNIETFRNAAKDKTLRD